ncbi:MAG: ChaN family lipoprotein [Myxococcota bacterium]
MVAIAALIACGPKAPLPSPIPDGPAPVGGPWSAPVAVDHPLVGRIWDPAAQGFVTEDALVAALAQAAHPLLGERHDNPDHHRLQARLITALHPPAVGFEMLDHADPVDGPTDADALAAAVGWADSGWPAFDLYRPVFDAVYGAGARVIAAHPTRDEVKAAMAGGFAALPAEALVGLALEPGLSEAQQASLADEIEEVHCGAAPPSLVAQMVTAQVLKDAWMARAIGEAGPGTVLVAGAGHTRTDRGVPIYVAGAVTVQFVEVRDGLVDPRDYDAVATWLWFTPRTGDGDPCHGLRQGRATR